MPVLTHNGKTFTFVWDVPGSPEETFLTDQARATARVRIAYDKRHEFIDYMAGFAQVITSAGKTYISRKSPYLYPYHESLYCVGSPRTEGLTPYGAVPSVTYTIPLMGVNVVFPSEGQPDYLDARVTLLFSSLPYRIRPDTEVLGSPGRTLAGLPDEGDALRRGIRRYITRSARPAGKLITIPGNFLYYENTNVPIPGSSATFFQPALDLQYVWHHVPEEALPTQAWINIPGSVNSEVFDGWPAETLLCQNPTFRYSNSVFGKPQYDVTYTFRFLPNWDPPPPNGNGAAVTGTARGHNYFPRIDPTDGKVKYIRAKTRGLHFLGHVIATGSSPYRTADFTALFRPDQP